MMIKYRVHEVAKDFDVSGKDMIQLLSEYFPDVKKSMTALEQNELNVVFEALTQKNSVESFEEYFALGEAARAARAEQRKAEQESRLEQQRLLAEQLKAQVKGDTPPADAATSKKKADSESKTPAGAQTTGDQQPKKPDKPGKKGKNRPADPAQPAKPHGESIPIPKREKKEAGAAPVRGPAEVRRVDTRTSHVELDKYNEKYEKIAPTSSMDKYQPKKQKIKQRSQNRRPPYAKRETEADKLRRIQLERIKKTPITVTVGEEILVSELALRMKKTAAEVIKQLMKLGMMVSVNEAIDYDTAEIVVTEMGAKIEREVVVTIEERIMDITEDSDENLRPRNPVVVVMGHVDHGKTSLLDKIRGDNVTATEAGGITQHIGAYKVTLEGKDITFLDTPGHSAFTSMRARGAQVTDIAILVVAADDGIMPQTIEAINHAKAAGVQMLVAINKMDKPEANPDRILQQLTEHSVVPEEWGGETICVPVSAKTGENIDRLLENVLLIADMMELRANPERRAKGAVIEARLDKGRGPVATLLIQNGTLKIGDVVVAGTAVGRVRAMINDRGERVEEAGPSTPVEITGLAEAPSAGDIFDAVSDERLARELVDQRKHEIKAAETNIAAHVTLDNLYDQLSLGEMKDLNIIVKADVQGSVEAVRQSLEKLTNEEVRVKVIHGGVGAVSESDVMLAGVSNAIIVGFNVRPDPMATERAERDHVDMRMYRIIYDCIEEIESAMKGMLAPKYRDVELGRIEVRQVYKISNVGAIAGCYVLSGKVTRSAKIRVVRDGVIIADDVLDSLRRFKDDVKEVAQGYECGIGLDKFNDIKENDILEAYITEEYRD